MPGSSNNTFRLCHLKTGILLVVVALMLLDCQNSKPQNHNAVPDLYDGHISENPAYPKMGDTAIFIGRSNFEIKREKTFDTAYVDTVYVFRTAKDSISVLCAQMVYTTRFHMWLGLIEKFRINKLDAYVYFESSYDYFSKAIYVFDKTGDLKISIRTTSDEANSRKREIITTFTGKRINKK